MPDTHTPLVVTCDVGSPNAPPTNTISESKLGTYSVSFGPSIAASAAPDCQYRLTFGDSIVHDAPPSMLRATAPRPPLRPTAYTMFCAAGLTRIASTSF